MVMATVFEFDYSIKIVKKFKFVGMLMKVFKNIVFIFGMFNFFLEVS